MEGSSDRQIAVALGVSKDTVPHMLADSDLLKEYRSRFFALVPEAVENVKHFLKRGRGSDPHLVAKVTMWTLENTQVGVKKTTADVSHTIDFLAGRSTEEKLFFAENGFWPDDDAGKPPTN